MKINWQNQKIKIICGAAVGILLIIYAIRINPYRSLEATDDIIWPFHPCSQDTLDKAFRSKERIASYHRKYSKALAETKFVDDFDRAVTMIRFADYQNAWILLKPLADQGDPYAQDKIGGLYSIAGCYQDAMEWYRKAANQGLKGAQQNISSIYFNGRGLLTDYPKAYFWRFISQDLHQMPKTATSSLMAAGPPPKRLEDYLWSFQMSEIERQATEWKDAHPHKPQPRPKRERPPKKGPPLPANSLPPIKSISE